MARGLRDEEWFPGRRVFEASGSTPASVSSEIVGVWHAVRPEARASRDPRRVPTFLLASGSSAFPGRSAMSKELVISANRHETRVAMLEDDQVVESTPAGKRIFAGRQHSQRPRDARAAGHAVGIRGYRPGARRVPLCLGFLRGQRGIRQDRDQRRGEGPEAGQGRRCPAGARLPLPPEPRCCRRPSRCRSARRAASRGCPPPGGAAPPGSRTVARRNDDRDRDDRRGGAARAAGGPEGRGLPESKFYSPGRTARPRARPGNRSRPEAEPMPSPRQPKTPKISWCCPANRWPSIARRRRCGSCGVRRHSRDEQRSPAVEPARAGRKPPEPPEAPDAAARTGTRAAEPVARAASREPEDRGPRPPEAGRDRQPG